MASRQGLARCLPPWRSAPPPQTANARDGEEQPGRQAAGIEEEESSIWVNREVLNRVSLLQEQVGRFSIACVTDGEAQHLGRTASGNTEKKEVFVLGHKHVTITERHFPEFSIVSATKPEKANVLRIRKSFGDQRNQPFGEILIQQQQPQGNAAGQVVISRRSLSAAKAKQARTSSWVS